MYSKHSLGQDTPRPNTASNPRMSLQLQLLQCNACVVVKRLIVHVVTCPHGLLQITESKNGIVLEAHFKIRVRLGK